MFGVPSRWPVVLLSILFILPASAQEPEKAGPSDVAGQIAAARRKAVDPLPPAALRSKVAGEANGEEITLADVLEEAVLLYAAPGIEALARQRAMALEAVRRGVEVNEKAFEAAVAEFLKERARGRSLADLLVARRISWPRFAALMRMNVATSALFRQDHDEATATRFAPDDPRGKAWVESIVARQEIVTDPARLTRGVYARVKATLPLRRLLELRLEQGATLTAARATPDSPLELRCDTLDGGQAVVRVEKAPVTVRDASGARPEERPLESLLAEWESGRYRVLPQDPKHLSVVIVSPADGGLPEYHLTDSNLPVHSEITGDELLALRAADLKLCHLDDALESRARLVAFEKAMRERGIEISAERVAERIERERARYTDGELTWERAIQLVGRNIYLETRRFRIADGVDQIIGTEASDEVLRAYYEAHIDHFGKATVTASHILVREADPETGRPDFAAAREKIREVYAKLRAGADFVDMVEEYSQDPLSRRRGGDVGMFTLISAYDEEFCRLAFALREGEVSPPVRTRQGYHIIYCRKRTPPDLAANPFEKIKGIVREDRQEDLRKRWLEAHVYGNLKVVNKLDPAWLFGARRSE